LGGGAGLVDAAGAASLVTGFALGQQELDEQAA
jgi:hypothetical protein